MTFKKLDESDKKLQEKSNIFSCTGKKIEEIKEVLRYKLPDASDVVTLKGSEGVDELVNEKYINEDNFRLQIGKMQKDGNTIYSPLMLRFGLEYIADHINTDEEGKAKAIIQLRPDLAQCLLQEDKEILSFEEEKKEIEKLIKKILGKKGKNIEIQNVADNYPDVFNALKIGKRGIIPSKEPKLENINLPIESPLPIIKFLAYHAKNDPKLMDVFYRTKPAKYIGQDTLNDHIPGSSDADYYSIVEVGIRLFEVLNGISIQGGIGRQRVYDKIISLIIFGKDKIGKDKDYDISNILRLEDYPALKNLHTRLINSGIYSDVKMNQLYIELNEGSLSKIERKVERKQKYKNKLKKLGAGLALFGALTFGGSKAVSITKDQIQRDKEHEELVNLRHNYPHENHGLGEMDYLGTIQAEEEIKLEAEYDLGEYEYNYDYYRDVLHRIEGTGNKIVDEYHDTFWARYNGSGKILTAGDFMKYFGGKLINQYGLPYQEPYEHLKTRKGDAITNTIKYGENIKLSESITKTSKEKKIYRYYNIGERNDGKRHDTDHLYLLRFINVLIDGEYKELVIAAKYNPYLQEIEEDFSLENGVKCMKDLQQNYGLDIHTK